MIINMARGYIDVLVVMYNKENGKMTRAMASGYLDLLKVIYMMNIKGIIRTIEGTVRGYIGMLMVMYTNETTRIYKQMQLVELVYTFWARVPFTNCLRSRIQAFGGASCEYGFLI